MIKHYSNKCIIELHKKPNKIIFSIYDTIMMLSFFSGVFLTYIAFIIYIQTFDEIAFKIGSNNTIQLGKDAINTIQQIISESKGQLNYVNFMTIVFYNASSTGVSIIHQAIQKIIVESIPDVADKANSICLGLGQKHIELTGIEYIDTIGNNFLQLISMYGSITKTSECILRIEAGETRRIIFENINMLDYSILETQMNIDKATNLLQYGFYMTIPSIFYFMRRIRCVDDSQISIPNNK